MTRTSLILLSHLCLLVVSGLAQSRTTESRPVRGEKPVMAAGVPRPEVTEPPGDQIVRMGLAAAKRYLDLANAATDPKEAAEYMRLYEEKERAVAALIKEREADRKLSEVLAGIRGWQRVAQEAGSRAVIAADIARRASPKSPTTVELQFREIEIELSHAREAEANAQTLRKNASPSIVHDVEAASTINQLQERVRRMEALLQEVRDLRSRQAESR